MPRAEKGILLLLVACSATLSLRSVYHSVSLGHGPQQQQQQDRDDHHQYDHDHDHGAAASFQAPRVEGTTSTGGVSPTIHTTDDMESNSSDKVVVTALPPIITWTNFGWNHPTKSVGLTYSRSLRSKDLMEGMQSHRWYDSSAWQRLVDGTADPHRPYYIFLDLESCVEQSWPNYGHNWDGNVDTEFHRNPNLNGTGTEDYCQHLPEVMAVVAVYPWAKIIVPDCRGDGPPRCMTKNATLDVSLASISARQSHRIRPSIDQGLPPPAVNPSNLTEAQVHDIHTCQSERNRTYLLTFSGNFRHPCRKAMKQLHRPPSIVTIPDYRQMRKGKVPYQQMLMNSIFAACPRGDNLFSYRFTEILSAGAIPVVWADGWVLPFRPELVHWAKCCAVILPERNVNTTIHVLESISQQRRCELRRNGYSIYKKYMETSMLQISGLVEGLELLRKNETSDYGVNWMQ